MKIVRILAVVLLACLLPRAANAAIIESVSVNVLDRGSTSKVLLERMSASMQTVAEQLLLDKDTEKVEPVRSEYTRLLGEVGDRVLNGYQMEQVMLQLGTQTQVTMVVSPWNEVINDVFVDLQFSGVEENTAALLQSKLPELQKQLEDVLQGSSADASDWAGGVLRRLVREKVEAELPEFRAAVDVVREDRRTVIQVVVYPVGQLVQSIDYEMVSQSIPNLLLLNIKQRYAQKTQELRGLPVIYVSRHKEELERSLLAELSAEPEVKRHNLRPSVVLTPGVNSGVRIRLESDEYKIWFEGYGDIGRNEVQRPAEGRNERKDDTGEQ